MDYLISLCDDIVERQDEAGEGGIDTNSQDLTGEKVAQAENPNVGNDEQPLPELRMDLTDDLLYLVCPALKFCLKVFDANVWHFQLWISLHDKESYNGILIVLQIFSFLGQKDLCRAGAACKQWHVASSHEDFWRSLKFDNIPISLENCMHLFLWNQFGYAIFCLN